MYFRSAAQALKKAVNARPWSTCDIVLLVMLRYEARTTILKLVSTCNRCNHSQSSLDHLRLGLVRLPHDNPDTSHEPSSFSLQLHTSYTLDSLRYTISRLRPLISPVPLISIIPHVSSYWPSTTLNTKSAVLLVAPTPRSFALPHLGGELIRFAEYVTPIAA